MLLGNSCNSGDCLLLLRSTEHKSFVESGDGGQQRYVYNLIELTVGVVTSHSQPTEVLGELVLGRLKVLTRVVAGLPVGNQKESLK
jgi:hypothetical protein